MAKREVEEINAGSMADIAFLLLIFFLITTTMNLPQVHEERLPQKSDVEFLLNERNVLQIMANKNDKIGIEGEFAEIHFIPGCPLDLLFSLCDHVSFYQTSCDGWLGTFLG